MNTSPVMPFAESPFMRRVSVAFILLLAAACSDEGFDKRAMVVSIGDTVIMPTYRDFAAEAHALDDTAKTFCDTPDGDGLAAVQLAYADAKTPLKEAEPFAFGPHVDVPLRLGPKVDFWPVREDTVDALLADDTPLSSEALDGLGAGARGFPVLGYLLHDPSVATPSEANAAVLARFAEDPRRCTYLVALTTNLAARADEYVTAWDPNQGGFLGQLTSAPPFEAASTLYDQVLFTVENVRELKIGKPLGKRNAGTPQLDTLEDRYGHRSLTDAIDALRGAENVYRGRYGDTQGIGIRDWLLSRKPSLDTPVLAAFDTALDALAALAPTLEQAIEERPEDVEVAYQAIKELQVLLAVDVSAALAVTVTFNPTDGD